MLLETSGFELDGSVASMSSILQKLVHVRADNNDNDNDINLNSAKSKRSKLTQACDRCREKKKKCDAKEPSCTRCVKEFGSSLANFRCQYDRLSRKRGPKSSRNSNPNLNEESCREMDDKEDAEKGTKADPQQMPKSSHTNVDEQVTYSPNKVILHLDTLNSNAENFYSNNTVDINDTANTFFSFQDTFYNEIPILNTPTFPYFENLNQVIIDPNQINALAESVFSSSNNFATPIIPQFSNPPTLEYHLLEIFYATAHNLFIAEPKNEFFKNYWPVNKYPNCLIHAMCAFSCRFSLHPEVLASSHGNPTQIGETYFNLAIKELDNCQDPLDEAHCLLILSPIDYGMIYQWRALEYMAIAIRKCELYGFNYRKTENIFRIFFGPQDKSVEFLKRMKRIWILAFFVDTMGALGAGIPTVIRDEDNLTLLQETFHRSFDLSLDICSPTGVPKFCRYESFDVQLLYDRGLPEDPIHALHLQMLFLLRQSMRIGYLQDDFVNVHDIKCINPMLDGLLSKSYKSFQEMHNVLIDWYYKLPDSMKPFSDLSMILESEYPLTNIQFDTARPLWMRNSLSVTTIMFFFNALVLIHRVTATEPDLLFYVHHADLNIQQTSNNNENENFNNLRKKRGLSSLQIIYMTFKAIEGCILSIYEHQDHKDLLSPSNPRAGSLQMNSYLFQFNPLYASLNRINFQNNLLATENLPNSSASSSPSHIPNIFNSSKSTTYESNNNNNLNHSNEIIQKYIHMVQKVKCAVSPPFALVQNPMPIFPIFAISLSLLHLILPSREFSNKTKKNLLNQGINSVMIPVLEQTQSIWPVASIYIKKLKSYL